MEFIDKISKESEANKIIDTFIDNGWEDSLNRYINITFNDIKPLIKKFLLKAHSNRCAYCMKHIEEGDMTIEHIIPESFKAINQSDFNKYLELDSCLINNVTLKDIFATTKRKKLTPPYPHDIAWYNLIPSCNSNQCCNLYRSKKFVKPFLLNRNEVQKIKYSLQGRCYSLEYIDDIEKLNINNLELVLIRSIWFYLRNKVTKDQLAQSELILSYITLYDEENKGLSGTFADQKRYKLLMDYVYFYDIEPD